MSPVLQALFLVSLAPLGAQVQPMPTEEELCVAFRRSMPVRRKPDDQMSLQEAYRKPGPMMTSPWFLVLNGVVAAPQSTDQSGNTPESVIVDGQLVQQSERVWNGKPLPPGERIWMVGSACRTSPMDVRRNRGAYVSLQFETERKYQVIEAGSMHLEPYSFSLRIRLMDMMGLDDEELRRYVFRLVSPIAPESSSAATVRLGQTRQQVEQALGAPEQVFDLGSKVVYRYKDFKVTFIDGKVADVN